MNQNETLDILKQGHNVYLTGPAGSGKTYTLNTYLDYLKENDVNIGVTASTGIAATHIGGQTIHSWAGIGIKDFLSEHDLEALEQKEHLYKRINKTKVLIIDEISMLADSRLDMVDQVCRMMKRSEEPFGGIQVVLSGDFFQLPPISKSGEEPARFAYHSSVWTAMDLRICYLEGSQRQTANDFLLSVLSDIRKNTISEETLDHLRRRYKKEPKVGGEGETTVPTKLYTHNIDVDTINERELEKIDSGSRFFEMTSRGKGPLLEALKKSCLAPERLELKVGARVMFVKNNFDVGYVNGTLGTVNEFTAMGQPVVRLDKDVSGKTGRKVPVEKAEWRIEEDGNPKAEIYQLPLRLAWAITVHKSQGMSLDAVEIDLSKSFAPGMGYVALSRVKTLDGLKLHGLNEKAREVAPEVLEVDEMLVDLSQKCAEELASGNREEMKRHQDAFLKRISPGEKERRAKAQKRERAEEPQKSTYEKTRELLLDERTLKEIAKSRQMVETTILGHLEKLSERNELPDISYLKPKNSRMAKIQAAFDKASDTKLAPVKQKLDNSFTFEELRLARLFL